MLCVDDSFILKSVLVVQISVLLEEGSHFDESDTPYTVSPGITVERHFVCLFVFRLHTEVAALLKS